MDKTRKKEEGSSPTLPTDIIEEILSRLPVKSLKRFRGVSKQWRILFTDPGFITKHLNRSTQKNPTHVLLEHRGSLYISEIESFTQTRKIHILFEENQSTKVHVEASCDGLVCLSYETTDLQEVRLFNPVTRECQVLPKDNCSSDIYFSCFGLGFDSKIKEYKIVKVTYMVDYVNHTHYIQTSIKICTLGSQRWRRIHTSLRLLIAHQSWKAPVTVSGAVHWVAIPKISSVYETESLLSFDFQREVFQEVPLPEFGLSKTDFHLGVGVLGGCLSLSTNFIKGSCVDIWVMKEYGVKESWTKLFSMSSVGSCDECILPLGIWKHGEILLQKGRGKLILYNPESKTKTKLGFHSLPCFFDYYFIMGSLVRPTVVS